ncbi:MAG: protein-disulfide reductase DsbD family protein [Fimbriimonas sp.]|nr:protein-disulfide reductase DsbD family protein [Fimbriimonas sp.]
MLHAISCLLLLSQVFHAPQAQTELVMSTIGRKPGKPFQIALHMKMAPEFHSYYINPGESGMATKIVWELPQGFHAGPIRWPVPKRIVVDGVAAYAYEDEVWLVTDIIPPSGVWRTTRELVIEANASWLLCKEACVPQHSKLRITVHLASTPKPNPAFRPALATLPQNALGLHLRARLANKAISLDVDRPGSTSGSIAFYPGDATYFGADVPTIKHSPTGIKLEIPLSRYAPAPPTRLNGLLVLPPQGGRGGGAHWIDIQVTKR